MNACLKLGGDPTVGTVISIHNYQVPDDIFFQLKEIFPEITPIDFKSSLDIPLYLRCGACHHQCVLNSPRVDWLLTRTHIQSSLQLSDGGIFLICRWCAERIRDFFESKLGLAADNARAAQQSLVEYGPH